MVKEYVGGWFSGEMPVARKGPRATRVGSRKPAVLCQFVVRAVARKLRIGYSPEAVASTAHHPT